MHARALKLLSTLLIGLLIPATAFATVQHGVWVTGSVCTAVSVNGLGSPASYYTAIGAYGEQYNVWTTDATLGFTCPMTHTFFTDETNGTSEAYVQVVDNDAGVGNSHQISCNLNTHDGSFTNNTWGTAVLTTGTGKQSLHVTAITNYALTSGFGSANVYCVVPKTAAGGTSVIDSIELIDQ